MPQFDKFTFAPQLCWVFILFLSLYVYFLRVSLPTIATTLKLRSKKLASATDTTLLGSGEGTNSSGLPYMQELISMESGDVVPVFSKIKKNAFLGSSKDSLRKNITKYVGLL